MRRTFWVLAALVLTALLLGTGTAEAAKSITAPDIGADVGQHASMVLDSSGRPVVSYYDATNGKLKVLHCGNTSCTSGNTITSPDAALNVGQYSSLALDSSGYPVISYYDSYFSKRDLKVMHCNDANCDPAVNGAESIESPDTGGMQAYNVGQYTSLALDGSGYPVISYYDASNGNLKVLHCGDANCSSGNTINSPDTGGDVGRYTSLVLDGTIPVVSYYDVTNGNLKVLRCGDANCSAGNTINSPDTTGTVGAQTSLALDDADNPVVSYYDVTNGNLKVLHCNDENCATGGDSITSPDTAGAVGGYTSLALATEIPVISYYDLDNGDLKVLHCDDGDCSGNESSNIKSPDTAGAVGQYTSLALYAGNPTVAYYDADHGVLKVLRCGDANCASGNTFYSADTGGDVGRYTSLVLDVQGKPVVSYNDQANGDLKVLHCGNPDCTSGNSITSPDTAGRVGFYTSLRLDVSGYPVISYWDSANGDLKVMHCNDANCAGNNEFINSPDTGEAGPAGLHTSLALDASGNPVVAYYKTVAQDLKVLHCDDHNCSGDETGNITTPDTTLPESGLSFSLVLDDDGYPVISYSSSHLKVLHCDDEYCAGDESGNITDPDMGDVGTYNSLALDDDGYPVISYYDYQPGPSHQNLKVLHCDDVDCSGDESGNINSPDTGGDVGAYTSLALDGSGNPVVSYYDSTNQNLKVLHCNDAKCAPGGDTITSPDTPDNVGLYTSLALDSLGKPVLSYYDATHWDLKVLHCDTPNCTAPAYPPASTVEFPVSLHFEHVWLDEDGNGSPETDAGAATFAGEGTFARGTPYVSGGYNTIDTEILSMELTGTVAGDQVTIKAGTEQGLSASTGKIREQTQGTLYPADTWFDLFFEVESTAPEYDGTQNCDFGEGAQAVHFTGVTMSVLATYVTHHVPSCPLAPPPASCTAGCSEINLLRYWCNDPSGTGIWMSVGGIAEWPGTAAGPDSLGGSSAGSGFNYTALGAALAAVAAVAVLAAGAWFARRRWAR